MPGRKALMVRNCERTLSSKAKSQSSSLQSSTVPACTKPAPLKSTSTAPASRRRGGDRLRVGDVEHARRAAAFGLERRERLAVDVGGDHARALAHEGEGGGAADALAGGGDEGGLACESLAHRGCSCWSESGSARHELRAGQLFLRLDQRGHELPAVAERAGQDERLVHRLADDGRDRQALRRDGCSSGCPCARCRART